METNLTPKVIGKATRQELIEREIIFDAPKKDVVMKVVNIQNDIEIKDIKAANGTILVSGYLNSSIMYTTMKRPQTENNNKGKSNENSNDSEKNGYVNTQSDKSSENNKKNKEQVKPRCGVVDNSIALDGVVRHTTVWIPFKSFIPAPEAQEGDSGTVISTAVLDNLKAMAVNPIYEDENDEQSPVSMMFGEEEKKFIKGIVNKTLIELTVEIKRYSAN